MKNVYLMIGWPNPKLSPDYYVFTTKKARETAYLKLVEIYQANELPSWNIVLEDLPLRISANIIVPRRIL